MKAVVKTPLLFTVLFAIVLIVNSTAIAYNTFYPEQPLMYFANQTITSLSDLWNVYAHPKMLDIFFIPFFRPSGHFLMYQLLVPLLGWHNTQGFIIVNLFFLALSGLLIIKIYEELFPTFKIGGFIAFSIYLMHPALILSRFIILHFEFAYVFFSLLSLYCFMLFCRKPNAFFYCGLSLLFYAVAVTFKEPAIMLGPALICYYFINKFNSGHFAKKQTLEVFALLAIITFTLGLYLTLQWPTLKHPFGSKITSANMVDAAGEFCKFLLCIPHQISSHTSLTSPTFIWREVSIPLITKIIMWALSCVTAIATFLVYSSKNNVLYKKSLTSLYIFSLLFLILPISWAVGMPWHLSLTLVFLSLAMGFCAEYTMRIFMVSEFKVSAIGGTIALLIALSTITVNNTNIHFLKGQQSGFIFKLLQNAVLHPPAIQKQLNPNSLIIIEDSIVRDGYYFGSVSPNFLPGTFNYDDLQRQQSPSFVKFQSIYTGTLFKWAYLMPTLNEQIFLFHVDDFSGVPNEFIYYWLQHLDNIFCLGYDSNANWHDRTALFKQNLLKEQAKRHIHINTYDTLPATSVGGALLYVKSLPFPDAPVCQYICDQDTRCNGFNYIASEIENHSLMECQFYREVVEKDQQFCLTCTGYMKKV